MPVTRVVAVLAAAEKKARAQETATVPQSQCVVLIVRRLPRVRSTAFTENIDVASLRRGGRIHPGLDGDGVAVVEVEQAFLPRIGHPDEAAFGAIKSRGLVGGGEVLELLGRRSRLPKQHATFGLTEIWLVAIQGPLRYGRGISGDRGSGDQGDQKALFHQKHA